MKLLNDIIEAHGGLKQWNQFSRIEARIISGGNLFELKGVPQDATPRQMTVWLHEQKGFVTPLWKPGSKIKFFRE